MVARLGEASWGDACTPARGGEPEGLETPAPHVFKALAPAVGPAGAAQGMKGLRGPRTPRARSQSWDMALWAPPDMEPRLWGGGELWLEQGPLSTQGSPHPLSQSSLQALTSGPTVPASGSRAPAALETSGRRPWPLRTHLLSDMPTLLPHPQLLGWDREPVCRRGHMSPSPFLTSITPRAQRSLVLAELGLLGIEASCPHGIPTRETERTPALAAPRGVFLLKACASAVATGGISSPHWGRLGEGVLTGMTLVCITRASKLLSKTCLLFN